MFLVKFFTLILTVFGVFCAENEKGSVDDISLRERREFIPEAWRAIEERMDMSGWIPQDSSAGPEEVPVVEKRRLRKRKRRPPHISKSGDGGGKSQDQDVQQPKHSPTHLRLSENEEVLHDMHRENLKQSNRRKAIPSFNSSERTEENEKKSDIEEEAKIESELDNSRSPELVVVHLKSYEKIRDPFDALKVAEKKQKSPEELKQFTLPSDLRALLKRRVGSISLSEILQQKNLSLSELLRGNSDAISALTGFPDTTMTSEASTEEEATTKYQRIPPSENKKMANLPFLHSGGLIEKIDNQKKDLLNDHKKNYFSFGITHTVDVVTEPITERRIFVPSQPKYKQTTRSQQSTFSMLDTDKMLFTTPKYTTSEPITEDKDNAVSSNTIVPPKSIFRKLLITSAKLMAKATTKPPTPKANIQVLPPKAIEINQEDNFNRNDEQVPSEIPDDPFKISLDLNLPIEHVEEQNPKLKIITAQEEITQILKNPFYRDRLSRILQERNMTIQELVEQRERGSSQLHLADIFHNKTREPEPIEAPFIGVIKVETKENSRIPKSRQFDDNTLKPKDLHELYSKSINEVTSTENIEPKMITTSYPTISEYIPTHKSDLNRSLSYAAIMPFWKKFDPTIFKQFYQSESSKWNDISPFDDNTIALSSNVNNKLGIDLRPNNYHLEVESFLDVPTGVKSALVASFVIVGLSIFMFLTIFVIFKWTQRKKNQLTYISSLSGTKIRAPILDIPRRNGLRNFMCETLGRKPNIYKSHLQSMSDVWDERKQKF